MLIEADRLSRHYGTGRAAVYALRENSFAVGQGEFVAVMGPSGSGKSTLMNILGLLDQPSSGRLVVSGEDTTRLSHDRLAKLRNSRIGFIFQSYNLLARNTSQENVAMPLEYSGLRAAERRRKTRAALEIVGLAHRLDHWPTELSGGEQQRVAIARALVGDPALIVADEPTGALDSRTGLDILALLQSLHRQGRTIVMVTHDDYVSRHASRILRLKDGAIVGDERVAKPVDAKAWLDLENAAVEATG